MRKYWLCASAMVLFAVVGGCLDPGDEPSTPYTPPDETPDPVRTSYVVTQYPIHENDEWALAGARYWTNNAAYGSGIMDINSLAGSVGDMFLNTSGNIYEIYEHGYLRTHDELLGVYHTSTQQEYAYGNSEVGVCKAYNFSAITEGVYNYAQAGYHAGFWAIIDNNNISLSDLDGLDWTDAYMRQYLSALVSLSESEHRLTYWGQQRETPDGWETYDPMESVLFKVVREESELTRVLVVWCSTSVGEGLYGVTMPNYNVIVLNDWNIRAKADRVKANVSNVEVANPSGDNYRDMLWFMHARTIMHELMHCMQDEYMSEETGALYEQWKVAQNECLTTPGQDPIPWADCEGFRNALGHHEMWADLFIETTATHNCMLASGSTTQDYSGTPTSSFGPLVAGYTYAKVCELCSQHAVYKYAANGEFYFREER